MIISHKHKFLFIGLPFSASSAITKELNLQYEGKPYLKKHSLYNDFRKRATQEELNYFVFAVLRNPMETVVTAYLKMKENTKGIFTNPLLYKENGGHITINQRKKFKFIQKNEANFEEYFLKFYTKPYDNFSRFTIKYCDFIIRYENIQNDYILALTKAGVKNPRPLPFENKTNNKEKEIESYYTPKIKKRAISVFGPFFKKYKYSFPKEWGAVRISKINIIKFEILGFLRVVYQYWIKNQSKNRSIKGSIYGDIQRETEI